MSRIDYMQQSPEMFKNLIELGNLLKKSSIEESIQHLIKIRASQINGCAFCLDLHSREARQAGIPQQKLDVLPAWRESSLYDERERAMLAVAEATSELPLSEESAADLSGALSVLGESTFAAAEWVAITINAFNRISILSEHPIRPRDVEGKVMR